MMSLTLRPFVRNGYASLRMGLKLEEAASLTRDKARLVEETFTTFSVPAGAPPIYWRVKDTVLRLVSENNARVFVVERPSAEDRRAEMLAGSKVFKGARVGSTYNGFAVAYQSGCSPLQYPISGLIAANEEQAELRGQALVRDGSCRIVAFKDAVMMFDF